MRLAKFALFLAYVLWPAAGGAQDSAEIGRVADTMVRLCLAGGHTESRSGGGSGGADLSLRSLDIKGELKAEVKVNKSSAEGLVTGIDNALSQVAADQADKVRACLQPVRERLLDVMLPPKRQSFEGQTVSAPGGVAAGRDITGPVTIGVTPEMLADLKRPWEELSESQKREIAKLQGDLDLNQRQVKSALEIVGEADVPPERLAAKLVEIAGKFKDLRTAAAAQPGDDSKITALKAVAQKAIQDGELDKAQEILARVEKIQDEASERLVLNAAQTAAQLGDLALARLRYPEAAGHLSRAAAKVPQGHDDERWKYLSEEADAFYRQGDEFGDN